MQRLFFTLLCFFSFASFAFAMGQDKSGQSIFDFWENEEKVSLELHVNFTELEANRRTEEFMPATVVRNGESLPLEVAVRGRFRRITCTVPPLKLKFKKDGLRARGLNTHNDFKLVTHCTDDEAGREAVRREQLAYELYRQLNPAASFRTKLLDITYVDNVNGSTINSVAILIEDLDELQGRLAADNCRDCFGLTTKQINNAEELALFQYMIGNVDYGTNAVRNLKLLRHDNGSATFVPYDFDYSGLVNTGYARPANHLGQRRITDRVLLWEYDAPADFTTAITKFQAHKDDFLVLVDQSELSASSKREVTRYLKGFFREIGKEFTPLARK